MQAGGFDALYREGMRLIEEVAAYLDGRGRQQSRALSREASFLYASESMRLTTRLMQLASWLLLQRAVLEGELAAASAEAEKQKVKLSAAPTARGGPGWMELPEELRTYILAGDKLLEQVRRFDKMERGEMAAPGGPAHADGVAGQLARLQAAFGKTPDSD